MDKQALFQTICSKKSFLCIGLDSDIQKIPAHLQGMEDPVFEFNRRIIDATHPFAVAYKPNMAFYESLGASGWISLEKTISYINQLNNKPFVIADAKRGDIGNTSSQYAKAFFDHLKADAVTLAPYMGEDSLSPFLGQRGKWGIVLVLTSNKGAQDFQFLNTNQPDGGSALSNPAIPLYESVMRKVMEWGSEDNLMFVVGATKAEKLQDIRKIAPNHFLLVPGVGAQGGSLEEVARYGMNAECGLLVNASRSIIYASGGQDFENAARAEARAMQQEMEHLLRKYRISC